MTSVPSSVSNCIRRLGLVRGVDRGPVGEDLEGPGLPYAVGLGPSWVLLVEAGALGTD